MRVSRLSLLVVSAATAVACGGSTPAAPASEKVTPTVAGEMSPEEAGGMLAEDASTTGVSNSPHGGTVVPLGSAGKLEFVLDPSSGMLTAYVLDGAGTAVMRIPARTIELEVTAPGGKAAPLVLNSTANGFTGDAVGNSSQFGGTAPALKGVTTFTGVVKSAVVGGQTFAGVEFGYPASAAR